jgi:adenosylcobinamide kinase/adenosylcobinamide-phosphate guanylyltransferase
LLELGAAREGSLILVTNEVGSGVVPPTVLGRAYRDVLGRVNQRAAAAASRAWLLVAGRALELPGESPAD